MKKVALYLQIINGIESFAKNTAVSLKISDSDTLEIKKMLSKDAPAYLKYSQIKAVEDFTETEIIEKNKSVVGRAVGGGIVFGPLGAIIGGMSGTGKKTKTKPKFYIVINYISSQADEIKVLTFSSNSRTNIKNFVTELKLRANISTPVVEKTTRIDL